MEFTHLLFLSPSLMIAAEGVSSMGVEPVPDDGGGSSGGGASGMGEEYQKLEYPVLYFHKKTGYYYDPVSISHNI